MTKYLEDRDLYYQLVLSKGKGRPTKLLERYLILIANRVTNKFIALRVPFDWVDDCQQEGLYDLLKSWKKFNVKKYDKALPYLTEVYKRGFTRGINIMSKKNKDQYKGMHIKFISYDIIVSEYKDKH